MKETKPAPAEPIAIERNKRRTITDLDRTFDNGLGQPIIETTTNRPFTLRQAIVTALGAQKVSAAEALSVFALAAKVGAAKNDVTLDESEYARVRGLVDQNLSNWGAFILAQVYQAID